MVDNRVANLEELLVNYSLAVEADQKVFIRGSSLAEPFPAIEGGREVSGVRLWFEKGITRFTREILFDEKIADTFHVAVGAGLPETGKVHESGIHWDMICDLRPGGQIWADGQLFFENGHFVLDL